MDTPGCKMKITPEYLRGRATAVQNEGHQCAEGFGRRALYLRQAAVRIEELERDVKGYQKLVDQLNARLRDAQDAKQAPTIPRTAPVADMTVDELKHALWGLSTGMGFSLDFIGRPALMDALRCLATTKGKYEPSTDTVILP